MNRNAAQERASRWRALMPLRTRGRRALALQRSIGLALSIAQILACSEGERASPAGAPECHGCNIVFVTYDALRADHLESYGYSKQVSPGLRELASRSIVFERVLSQSGTTLYSIPSIMTGRYPHLDGLIGARGLPDREQTLAEILNAAGYSTGATIAWFYAGCHFGFCAGFEQVDGDFGWADPAARAGDSALDRLAELRDREPFFLWLHLRRPHAPYGPPPALFESFYDPIRDGPSFASEEVRALATDDDRETLRRQVASLTRHYESLGEVASERSFSLLNGAALRVTPSVERQVVALYDASIREADDQLLRLLAAIDAAGLSARTVIVIASDHGEGMGEHGLFEHNDLWYGILRTPLIIHVPGVRPQRKQTPAMNVDILPTLLELVGLPEAPGLRGRDLFAAEADPTDRPQYAEYDWGFTLVTGTDKLLVRGTGAPELYDIEADPNETHDLAPRDPERVARLLESAARLRGGAAKVVDPAQSEMRERLRALGYIE